MATTARRARLAPTKLRAAYALITALVLALTLALPLDTAEAATRQRIVNGNFESGTTGWQTGDQANHKFAVTKTGRSNSKGAEITPSNTSAVVLSDAKSTVTATQAGSKYAVGLYVRSSRAGVNARVQVLESNSAGNSTSTATATVSSTSWTKIMLDLSAKRSGSTLDLAITFTGTAAGQKLYVDDASFRELGTSTSPPASPPPSGGTCTRPAPPTGTQFGSSISTTSTIWAEHALADRDSIFGKIASVRIWDQPMPFSWNDRRTPHLAGRTLVMSFRPEPSEVLSGKHDAQLREWFQKAPSTSTIYWNYYHEPETPITEQNKFTADIYKRAWQHIDKIADSVCRQNMYATLVLMNWTTNPSSKLDWRTYYPGADVIDVLAFDSYNSVHDVNRDFYATPESILDNVVRVSKEAGKPWALAELGSRKVPSDTTGSKRAAWLNAIAAYSRKNGAVFVTYFHSTNGAEWRLLDKPSQDAWRAAVSSSPR